MLDKVLNTAACQGKQHTTQCMEQGGNHLVLNDNKIMIINYYNDQYNHETCFNKFLAWRLSTLLVRS